MRWTPSQERSRSKIASALEAAESLALPRVAEAAARLRGALHPYLSDRELIVAPLSLAYRTLVDRIIERVDEQVLDDPVGHVLRRISEIERQEEGARAVRSLKRINDERTRRHTAWKVERLLS